MRLYHYVAKGNTVLTDGILSFAQNPHADLSYYYKRSGETTHNGICQWMERCFKGRSRAVRAFSEPIQYTEKSINMFKPLRLSKARPPADEHIKPQNAAPNISCNIKKKY